VFYGQENAYGVVSGVKNTRAGINQYLGGFLKEENTRFRDHEIKFARNVNASASRSKVALTYPKLSKKWDSFSFSAEAGQIRSGEVVGIMGRNAIGKSLFVKLLAGVEKNESGEELEQNVRVSYKPQYVKALPGLTVAQLFAQNKLDVAFHEEASRKLNVTSLADKELEHLSGGELQRVSIVLALSQPAELYLLDEPSAFLDVEQRLHLAGLLQRLIQNSGRMAMVVDHDLVFLDAISSRVMVFEGQGGVKGHANAPADKRAGLNAFLKQMDITLRRDPDTGRPRINKPDSALEREQKEAGEYYYYEREAGE
jgi:ATP-binding cassette subfamily E protein 1